MGGSFGRVVWPSGSSGGDISRACRRLRRHTTCTPRRTAHPALPCPALPRPAAPPACCCRLESFLELPLYLLFGAVCGVVSASCSFSTRVATDAFAELREQSSVEAALLPAIGGLTTGVLALGYPEILYQVCAGLLAGLLACLLACLGWPSGLAGWWGSLMLRRPSPACSLAPAPSDTLP